VANFFGPPCMLCQVGR